MGICIMGRSIRSFFVWRFSRECPASIINHTCSYLWRAISLFIHSFCYLYGLFGKRVLHGRGKGTMMAVWLWLMVRAFTFISAPLDRDRHALRWSCPGNITNYYACRRLCAIDNTRWSDITWNWYQIILISYILTLPPHFTVLYNSPFTTLLPSL